MHSLNGKDGTADGNHGRNAEETTDKSEETVKKIISANSGNTDNQTETKPDDQHYTNERDSQSDNTVEEGTIQSVKKSTGETIQSEVNKIAHTYEDKSGNTDGNSKASTELQQLTDKITGNDSSKDISDNSKTSNTTPCRGAQVELSPQDMVEHQEDAVALSPNTIELSKYMVKSEATVELSHHTLHLSNDAVETSQDNILNSGSCETNGNIAIQRQNQKDVSPEDGQNLDTSVNEMCLSAPITIEADEHPGAPRSTEGDVTVPIPESFADNLGSNTSITNTNIGDPIIYDSKEANQIDEPAPRPSAEMPGLTTPITIDTIRKVSESLKADDCDNFENRNKTVKHTRIVMIGITGCGKSATGNSLLGKKVFKTSAGSTSMTSRCEYGRRDFEDRILDVVDTPGLYDTDRSEENVKQELARCICMLSPGPHAFLIVIRVGRFNEQEQKTVESLVNFFGEDGFLKYSIVIITRKDELEYEQTTLEKFINDSPPALKQIINQCGGRCFAVNNRLRNKDEMDNQTKQLVSLIDDMVTTSGGNCYTHSLFAEVEKERQKKLDEEKKRKEEEERLKLENEKEMMRQKREMEMKLREQEMEIDKERQRRKKIERDMEREKREREWERIRSREREIKERERKLDRERERAWIERERYEIAREEANKKSHCIVS